MQPEIDVWFNSWDRLASVAQGSLFFFVYIVLIMRVSGKRTASQMNNFDWIVTVAIGSLAASGILLQDVSVADAALAIAILTACQWATTWLITRSEGFSRLVKPAPRLLMEGGRMLTRAMRRERISHAELLSRLRRQGYVRGAEAQWVVLETDGSLTVIPRQGVGLADAETMGNVRWKT